MLATARERNELSSRSTRKLDFFFWVEDGCGLILAGRLRAFFMVLIIRRKKLRTF